MRNCTSMALPMILQGKEKNAECETWRHLGVPKFFTNVGCAACLCPGPLAWGCLRVFAPALWLGFVLRVCAPAPLARVCAACLCPFLLLLFSPELPPAGSAFCTASQAPTGFVLPMRFLFFPVVPGWAALISLCLAVFFLRFSVSYPDGVQSR